MTLSISFTFITRHNKTQHASRPFSPCPDLSESHKSWLYLSQRSDESVSKDRAPICQEPPHTSYWTHTNTHSHQLCRPASGPFISFALRRVGKHSSPRLPWFPQVSKKKMMLTWIKLLERLSAANHVTGLLSECEWVHGFDSDLDLNVDESWFDLNTDDSFVSTDESLLKILISVFKTYTFESNCWLLLKYQWLGPSDLMTQDLNDLTWT